MRTDQIAQRQRISRVPSSRSAVCGAKARRFWQISDIGTFVADFCEPNRPYTAAQEVRELAERDLEAAVLEVMQFKLRKTLLKKQPVHPDSFHAYNALLNKRNRETV